MASIVARMVESARGITGSGGGSEEEGTSQAISSLRVSLAGMVTSAILSLYYDCPWLTAVPAVIINVAFLQVGGNNDEHQPADPP